jgi:hypothetical protein
MGHIPRDIRPLEYQLCSVLRPSSVKIICEDDLSENAVRQSGVADSQIHE